MKPKNLAVVGGGPIGMYSAIRLARMGHKVDLIEKSSLPKDKVCGQGIMPSGIKLLEEIGLSFNHGIDSYPFNEITYYDGNNCLSGQLRKNGIGLERMELSEKLYNLVKSEKNITEKLGYLVKKSTMINKNCYLEGESTDGEAIFSKLYDYVFVCDGLNSIIRQNLQNTKTRPGPYRLGARFHCETAPKVNSVQVYWSKGIEAYITPVSDQKIEVAFLWFEDQLEINQNLKKTLMSKFPTLSKLTPKNNHLNDFKAYGPFKHKSQNIKSHGYFFIGDAYNFYDGITGEGISLGLKSAKTITENFSSFNFLNAFSIKLDYFKYESVVKFCLYLSKNVKIRKYLFKCCNKIPNLFDHLLRINDV
jgi:2-polyprenyl-6-methoxyphenol hydroxylase-like FAD-dependent oxidoreductase